MLVVLVCCGLHSRLLAQPARARCAGGSTACVADDKDSLRRDIRNLWQLPCADDQCVVADDQADVTALGTLVSRDSTVTVLWKRHDWEKHTEIQRYARHLLWWPRSTILRRLLPLLGTLAAWSALIHRFGISLPAGGVGYIASPLSLLLAFRVNAASARFQEARTLWGRAIFLCRELAGGLATARGVPDDVRQRCCRYLIAMGWSMKAAMRSDTDVSTVLDCLLRDDEASWVAKQRKPTIALVGLVRRATLNLDLPVAQASYIAQLTSDLNLCYGGMERILSTPLSPTYMRHTSRGLFLLLAMLPAALIGSGVSSLVKILAVTLPCAYVMVGIDEIGIQIEQPFDALPLHGLAVTLTKDVVDELCPLESPPA